jgi:pyruvate/2-oxoglutarate dehydrogenase complex dihydrolipoamide dehydrogenase (E3) component
MGKQFTPTDVRAFDGQAIILALGSTPVTPGIEGIEFALSALDVYSNPSRVGKIVAIVGGGLVGCEVGLHLMKNGRDVTIVEMLDEVAPDAYRMHRVGLVHEMEGRVTCRTGLTCTAVKSDGVKAIDKKGTQEFIPADTVIYAIGMSANREETERLRAAAGGIPVYEIGDCVRPGKVYDALHQAFIAAMSIL